MVFQDAFGTHESVHGVADLLQLSETRERFIQVFGEFLVVGVSSGVHLNEGLVLDSKLFHLLVVLLHLLVVLVSLDSDDVDFFSDDAVLVVEFLEKHVSFSQTAFELVSFLFNDDFSLDGLTK